MQQQATASGRWDGWVHDLAIATGLGVFLAATGPYGSYLNGPFWQRLCFQLPCCWMGLAVIGTGVRLAVGRLTGGVRLWAAVAVTAVVAMVPVTVLNIVLAQALLPFLSHVMTPARWYGEGLLISEPVSFGFAWLGLHRRSRVASAAPPLEGAAIRPSPGLLAVDPRYVLCLQMEDHYVRVHTQTGSHLVLTTFGLAQEAMAQVAGMRIHRSWWVADTAVTAAERDGRNLRLILVNAMSVPVARTSVADARARGWLQDQR